MCVCKYVVIMPRSIIKELSEAIRKIQKAGKKVGLEVNSKKPNIRTLLHRPASIGWRLGRDGDRARKEV